MVSDDKADIASQSSRNDRWRVEMLSQVPTTHCMSRTKHHRRTSLLGPGSLTRVGANVLCGAPHFGKHGSGRSDIRADAYVPTVRTGEVRNRPTSDRIRLFNGQSCLGKRDRFAAAGTIDHEVSFWLNDCHHGRQHSIILTKIRNKILVPHRGFQRLRQLARPIRTGQWYAPHTRGLVVNSVASTPFAA